MCRCGLDASTPFCDGPNCEWPDDTEDHNDAITDFLHTARILAQYGVMPFREYLDLCVEFDPAFPDDDDEDDPEGDAP
jgi:hypothetical protein